MLKKRLLSALTLLLALALVLSVSFMGATKASRVIAEEETSATDDPKGEGDTEDGAILTTGTEDGSDSAETIGATPEENGTDQKSDDEEKKEEKIKFSLIDEIKEIDLKGWLFLCGAVVIAAATIIYLVKKKKEQKTETAMPKLSTTTILVQGALCIALSFILSYIKLFSMPNSGSVTLASMLPLMIFANRHGVKWGIMAGAVYGVLQFIQSPHSYHWAAILLEYPVAFGVIGLGGLTKGINKLPLSVLIGGFARFLMHFIDGAIFFGSAGVPAGTNLWASLLYQAPYMLPDIAICLIIALLPPFRKAIKKALRY